MSYYSLFREFFRYYILKMGLYAMYLRVRLRSALGFTVDENELKDFELDVIEGESDTDKLGKMDDSKTFEQMAEEQD